MSVASNAEILECRYCKIPLACEGASIGFVDCPQCFRSYLRVPQSAFESSALLNATREKLLNIYKTYDSNTSLPNDSEVDLLHKSQNSELEFNRLQDLIHEKNQIIIQLNKEVAEAIERFNAQELSYEAIELENSQKTIALANLGNDMTELKDICLVYEKKIEGLELEIKIEKQRVEELNLSLHVIPDLECELDKAKASVFELRRVLNTRGDNSTDETELQATQIDLLNAEINALKLDVERYVSLIAELESAVEAGSKINLERHNVSLVNSLSYNSELEHLRSRVQHLEQIEQKMEHVETELEISRDELEKAQKEIASLNALLEKAFYENQKKQEIVSPLKEDTKLLDAVRHIEKREEELASLIDETNAKIEAFLQQTSMFKSLVYNFAVIREDDAGRVVQTIFDRNTILPLAHNELRKVITYKTSLNKGRIYYQHEDERNLILNDLTIDFTSNANFFLTKEEFTQLAVDESEVLIREEYILTSEGEVTVCFYRNNGFKKFESRIGKLIYEPVQGIQKIQIL